jgi:hypothetical protein
MSVFLGDADFDFATLHTPSGSAQGMEYAVFRQKINTIFARLLISC